jgi:peptidoglycan/xylan/chitin deacetylase (PgdA/CDA1 family)
MAGSLGQIMRDASRFVPAGLLRPFGRPVALFFHGVERATDDARVQTNHHEVDAFRAIAKALRDDFQVLPLGEIGDVLRRPQRHRHSVFLMSDDGYANTATVAADILEEMGLPWTLFVSTHHVDTAERNPVFLIRLFFHHGPAGRHNVPHLGSVELGSLASRAVAAQAAVEKLKALDATRANEAVEAMRQVLAGAGLSALLERFSSETFLTWPQILALKKRGVEIGAHADWHWPMHGAQSADYLREQALLPRKRIEAEIGPCRAFAYPFGNKPDVCRTAWQAVRDAGYDYAFTTLSGSLDASTNPYLLPRYGLAAHEPNLASVIPVLRAGNARLADWQRQMAG